ncbi:hypothetical protein B296_00022195 [Ensete ventricosum]|uniref:Uncharacterized protein n=1 Tax=Ensete ventricosum TaxID=4639 RepID=A0A426Y0Y6_ENSVE|nr:hypothetical protein B296_00022195 [Ensete ventricosum]
MRSHRRSLGDSLKGLESSLGTRREIAERRPEDSLQEYRRLLDWRERLTCPVWAVDPPRVSRVWSSPKEDR